MARAARVPESEGSRSAATREALLDAAEILFARDSFAGVSLRAITRKARANLAAVSYHFGGKEELYREMLRRRLHPINAARLRLLDAALAAHAPRPVPLPALLEVFLRPVADLVDATAPAPHPFVRVMGRFLLEPPAFVEAVATRDFAELGERYGPHLLAQLPHLTPATLLWRMRFVIGAATATFGRMQVIERRLVALGAPVDGAMLLRQLIAFVEAGLRAPDPAAP